MVYDPNLNKAVSKLTTRGALQYVYQDPNHGEFVASDGRMMLVQSGMPPIAEFWDTITQMPANCNDKYPDWREVLANGDKNACKFYFNDKVLLHKSGLTQFGQFYISTSAWEVIKSFVGADIIINVPDDVGYPLYFCNTDKSRQALALPWRLSKERKAVWNVLDACGTIIHTTTNLNEAEMFGLTVKLEGE